MEKILLKELKNEYRMHELLQMGQRIVHKDHPQELGRWNKLWIYKDINNVLVKNSEKDHL